MPSPVVHIVPSPSRPSTRAQETEQPSFLGLEEDAPEEATFEDGAMETAIGASGGEATGGKSGAFRGFKSGSSSYGAGAGDGAGSGPEPLEDKWVSEQEDSFAVTALSDVMDRATRAGMARFSMGLSPTALAEAYLDWGLHLSVLPGRQLHLAQKAWRKNMRLARYMTGCALPAAMTGKTSGRCIEPLPQDSRFREPGWATYPFNVISQAFLLNQQWWHNATTGVRGVTKHHQRVVDFVTRQVLDMMSPSNFVATNPEVLQRTLHQGGMNLVRGAVNLVEDMERLGGNRPPVGAEAFKVGEKLAVTPGKVVYRNRLIELIQYSPTTDEVHPEPVLIVPAWIMKYYILDLSPENSLVRYLVSRGFTVFMISWLNPGKGDRDLGMDDYRKLGVEEALKVALAITGAKKCHTAGYCLGGTLLSIAVAGLAHEASIQKLGMRELDLQAVGGPVASVSLFAAQTDFTEAGELTLFVDESAVAFLEDMMWEQGYLDSSQMSGAFQLLRSKDLIWSRVVHEYLMGERSPMFDLLAWNSDGTRMPYRMHSEYLRGLFLNNDFAEGRYKVEGHSVSVEDIKVPIFAVGTEHDHVAPWRSVFKIHHLSDTEVTFVLTAGGHNAGIVSEPGHKGRHYRIMTSAADAGYVDPDAWVEEAAVLDGSWWETWSEWLAANSGELGDLPPMGKPEAGYPAGMAAPGSYVLMR